MIPIVLLLIFPSIDILQNKYCFMRYNTALSEIYLSILAINFSKGIVSK